MISVMVAKWVGDAFGKDGIYALWIAMRRYPWLPPVEYRDKGETADQFMTPTRTLVMIENGISLEEIGEPAQSVFKADLRRAWDRSIGEDLGIPRIPSGAEEQAGRICRTGKCA